jgi:RNA polymerase sigma-70 factor (ECF subfamily)
VTDEKGSPAGAPDREQLLAALRPVAFGIAYRMLGSVTEAEDVVQEALLRVHRALESGEQLESPRAFTATVTTRLAMDELRSARVRRERYVGDWLPEPILTDGQGAGQDPAREAETADSLSMALLVLLESLSPEQRAVLLLHDVFGYGYGEVAAIVGKGAANVRQLAVRARRHVEDQRPRFTTTPEQQNELASRFFAAARTGDLAALESLLAHDVELVGDGGGKAPSLARSQQGRSRVAHTLTNWLRALRRLPEMEIRLTEVNGDPGAMFLVEGRLLAVWALDIRGSQVAGVRAVVNPDKLVHLGPVGDANALIRRLGGVRPGS